MLGYETTLQVTNGGYAASLQGSGAWFENTLLVGGLPFLSYQVSVEEAVRNSGRLLQEGGVQAVKLEGGRERAEAVRAITSAGIPVMGHLGLTPQSVNKFGGFGVQANTATAAQRLLEDAQILQHSGCFSIVLESIPARLAEFVSKRLDIPTIGLALDAGCVDRFWFAPDSRIV